MGMFAINKKRLSFCLLVSTFLSIFVLGSTNVFAQQPAPGQSLEDIRSWFFQYDQIRHAAQMSPAERQQADHILGKGLALFMPGDDKIIAQRLLTDLVKRYDFACQQLGNLRVIPATEQLHRGYFRYFSDARCLFSDYLKLQADLLAVDPATGQPLASGLIDRKQGLEQLEQNNKALDRQLRLQYNIPPYQY
jgi:hypothetical protein